MDRSQKKCSVRLLTRERSLKKQTHRSRLLAGPGQRRYQGEMDNSVVLECFLELELEHCGTVVILERNSLVCTRKPLFLVTISIGGLVSGE